MTYTIITGGTSGIGKATAYTLAKAGHRVTLFARNEAKAMPIINDIRQQTGNAEVYFMACDLASLKSVAAAAENYTRTVGKLDCFIANAGGFVGSRTFTEDGFESSFQANFLSHFLLVNRLLPLLEQSSDARIINVSSEAHKMGKFDLDNLNAEKGFKNWPHYGLTKLLNALFSVELHRRFHAQGIASFALHPGVVRTNLGNGEGFLVNLFFKLPFLKTPEQGAATTIYLATAPKDIRQHSGKYFKDSKLAESSRSAQSTRRSQLLWEKAEQLLTDKGFALQA